MPRSSTTVAFVRFHVAGAMRLAMRTAVPVAAAIVVAAGIAPSAEAFLAALASGLASANAVPLVPCVAASVAGSITLWAGSRFAHGALGWIRHLPASDRSRNHALLAALVVAQTPVLLVWIAAWCAVRAIDLAPGADPSRLVSLVPVAAGAALLGLPVRPRTLPAIAGAVALVLGIAGSWGSAATGTAAAGCGLVLAGGYPPTRGRLPAPPRAARGITDVETAVLLRAVGRILPLVWLVGSLPPAAALVFSSRNGLDAAAASGAARLGAGLGSGVVLSWLAGRTSARRPPWPWARSLAISSRHRVARDAAVFGVAALPPILVVAGSSPWSAAAVAATVPWLALRAAGAVRRRRTATRSAAGPVLGESALLAGWLALSAWLAPIALASAPIALALAAERDRSEPAMRWVPERSVPSGDPLSWSGG